MVMTSTVIMLMNATLHIKSKSDSPLERDDHLFPNESTELDNFCVNFMQNHLRTGSFSSVFGIEDGKKIEDECLVDVLL